MKNLFLQPSGSTSRTTSLIALARKFNLTDKEVISVKKDASLVGIKGLYDKDTSTFWLLPSNVGATLISFIPPLLKTNTGDHDLTDFNIKFENYHVMSQYSFEKGFTLNYGTQVVEFEGELYRWGGEFPKQVAVGSTPESTGGIDETNWIENKYFWLKDGASKIKTENGLSIQEAVNRRYAFVEDFLPTGYVKDASVSYTSAVQEAINQSANRNQTLIMPNFPLLIDPIGTEFSGLTVPSNSHIIFDVNSSLIMKPNDLGGYELLSIRDKNNIFIENAVLIGDKYTHTGTEGEWGNCLSIRGDCNNIKITNPIITDAWGDGIYIGQTKDSATSTPKNVYIMRAVIDKCRRQGISIISADGLFINDTTIKNTKSSDSSFTLKNGPHAGIDIEPNHFNSKLNNIRINNLNGYNNDAALLMVYLGGCDNQAPENGVYEVDLIVNGLSDNRSNAAIHCTALGKVANFAGNFLVSNLSSKNAKRNGVIHEWSEKLPVMINGCYIENWHSGGSTPQRDLSPISIYNLDANKTNPVGGLSILGLKLVNNKPDSEISEYLTWTENVSGKGVAGVFISFLKSIINKQSTRMQHIAGMIDYTPTAMFGGSSLRKLSGSFKMDFYESGDYLVNKPTALPTYTLPMIEDSHQLFIGWKFRIKIDPTEQKEFRIRNSNVGVNMYVNGTTCVNVKFSDLSGVVSVEYDGISFYVNCKGPFVKEE